MLTVLAAAAEMERGRIAQRCDEGRKVRKSEGKRLGEVPFGWTVDPSTNVLVESTQEQEIIRLIGELKADGYTVRAIAADLNRRGLASKKGKAWNPTQVQRIVQKMRQAT